MIRGVPPLIRQGDQADKVSEAAVAFVSPMRKILFVPPPLLTVNFFLSCLVQREKIRILLTSRLSAWCPARGCLPIFLDPTAKGGPGLLAFPPFLRPRTPTRHDHPWRYTTCRRSAYGQRCRIIMPVAKLLLRLARAPIVPFTTWQLHLFERGGGSERAKEGEYHRATCQTNCVYRLL
jgi:hypothetical protein